jgi:hypothetical protein
MKGYSEAGTTRPSGGSGLGWGGDAHELAPSVGLVGGVRRHLGSFQWARRLTVQEVIAQPGSVTVE